MHSTETRRNLRMNLLLAVMSIFVTLAIIEIGLRLFFPITDFQYSRYDPQLAIAREPDQDGHFVVGPTGEVNARYHINADGWNSTHDAYTVVHPPNTLRVAVVGDSFVEAMQVDVDQAFPEMLDGEIGDACGGQAVEAYRFGLGGTPMSHYLLMMRYSVRYSPDAFVVLLIVNDFTQSIYLEGQGSPYLTLRQTPDGFEEVRPPHFEAPRARWLDWLATRRYLNGNLELLELMDQLGLAPTFGPAEPPDRATTTALVRYVLEEYQRIADGKPLLILMDADRQAIYDGAPPQDPMAGYAEVVSDVTGELGIDFIDLTETFAADYAAHGQRFEFSVDGHWNAYAHRLVAGVTADWVQEMLCGN